MLFVIQGIVPRVVNWHSDGTGHTEITSLHGVTVWIQNILIRTRIKRREESVVCSCQVARRDLGSLIRAEFMLYIRRFGYLELSSGPYRLKYIDQDWRFHPEETKLSSSVAWSISIKIRRSGLKVSSGRDQII